MHVGDAEFQELWSEMLAYPSWSDWYGRLGHDQQMTVARRYKREVSDLVVDDCLDVVWAVIGGRMQCKFAADFPQLVAREARAAEGRRIDDAERRKAVEAGSDIGRPVRHFVDRDEVGIDVPGGTVTCKEFATAWAAYLETNKAEWDRVLERWRRTGYMHRVTPFPDDFYTYERIKQLAGKAGTVRDVMG